MADPVYNIWIRDLQVDGSDQLKNKLRRRSLVTVYSKLEFKIVYNNVGGWTLRMPGDTDEANLLKSLLIGTPGEPTNTGQGYGGIIVTRNGNIVFSGPVRGFTETGDYTGPEGKEIEFYGIDDTGYLNARIPMVPAPEKIGNPPVASGVPFIPGSNNVRYFVAPAQNGWPYQVYGGPTITTTTVIYNLVETNIGKNAPFNLAGGFANRRIPFFDTPALGAFGPKNFKSRSRYAGTLLEKVQEAATYWDGTYTGIYPGPYRGVAFRVVQTTSDRLEIRLWDPRDPNHNKGLVFSAGRGNLGGYKYNHQAPNVNFSVVGGQADDVNDKNGTTRWFAHLGSELGITDDGIGRYGLWEGYLDRRDIQYDGELKSNPAPGNPNYINMKNELVDAMSVQLREEGEQVHIEVTALNVPGSIWSEDYNVGDIVRVVIDDFFYDQIVRDVTVTLTKKEGEVVVPTIGTEATGQSIRLFEKINSIDTSINTLNSSQ